MEIQEDIFVNTTKYIKEYLGREYSYGVDIRDTVENMIFYSIPVPIDPVSNYSDVIDSSGYIVKSERYQVPYMDTEIFKQEIN